MSQLEEAWKLTLSTHPPANWIIYIKIFGRKLEILFRFIVRVLLFPATMSHKGFLR
jgi:hypothetical protein